MSWLGNIDAEHVLCANTLEIKEVLLPGRCARALHIIDLCLDMESKSLENHADKAGQYMEKKTCFWNRQLEAALAPQSRWCEGVATDDH